MSIKKQEASRRKLPLTFSLLLILAYFNLQHTEHWHTQAHINHVSVFLGVTHQGQLNPVISYLCYIEIYRVLLCRSLCAEEQQQKENDNEVSHILFKYNSLLHQP